MSRLKDGAGALKLLNPSDFDDHTDSVLYGDFIVRPNSRCFSLTRARKVEMNTLRQLVDHFSTQVIPHDAARMIEKTAHEKIHRYSIYVLAGEDY